MPSIRHVLETSLYCDDLAATARFYEEVVGLRVHFSDARLVALDASGSSVLLLFARGTSRMGVTFAEGTIPGHDGSGPAHLAFAVDAGELDAWETRLAAVGVAIESRIHWARGGESIYFRDPEGHSVELATPGVWPTMRALLVRRRPAVAQTGFSCITTAATPPDWPNSVQERQMRDTRGIREFDFTAAPHGAIKYTDLSISC